MSRRRRRPPAVPAPTAAGNAATARRPGRDFVTGVLPLVAVVVVTRVALAEPYRIPSGSMEPTLLVGDWLFVNKLRFGPHVPFTDASLPGYAAPRRGDVAVFVSPPQDPSIRIAPDEVTPILVKRIVGAGGDTLAMRGGRLYVNGIGETGAVATRASGAATSGAAGAFAQQPLPIFQWQHGIETSATSLGPAVAAPTLHDWGPLVVPRDAYFMMGDNRDDSVDSRFYGPVPRRNLLGRPTFVYYSYDAARGAPFVRALTEIRWRRLGTWIR